MKERNYYRRLNGGVVPVYRLLKSQALLRPVFEIRIKKRMKRMNEEDDN